MIYDKYTKKTTIKHLPDSLVIMRIYMCIYIYEKVVHLTYIYCFVRFHFRYQVYEENIYCYDYYHSSSYFNILQFL